MLRIASKAETVDKFIHVFSHFCDRDSFFIVTRKPKEQGTETRFAIHLENGEPVISGKGMVEVAYADRENPYRLPGMKLRFVELYGKSAEVIERLVAAKEGKAENKVAAVAKASDDARPAAADETDAALDRLMPSKPTTASGTVSPPPGKRAGSSAEEIALAEAQKVAEATHREERAKGSDFILPANPFGELTDHHLEAFVECSLYEDVAKVRGDSDESADLPAWWPDRASVTTLASAAERVLDGDQRAATEQTPMNTGPPGSPGRAPTPPPVSMTGPVAPATPAAYPPSATPPPGVMPGLAPQTGMSGNIAVPRPATEPHYSSMAPAHAAPYMQGPPLHREGRRPVMLIVLVAVALTALATLGAAYLMWGESSGAPSKNESGAGDADQARNEAKHEDKDEKTGQVDQAGTTDEEQVAGDRQPGDEADEAALKPDEPDEPVDQDEATDTDESADEGTQAAADLDEDPVDTSGAAAEDGEDDASEAGDPGIANLAPGMCLARLVTEPDGADVVVDNRKIGVTPMDAELPCGEVALHFRRARREPTMEKTRLTEGELTQIDVRLDRPKVSLTVSSTPPKAEIKVNGKSIGQAPVTTEVAAFRAAKIEASKPGYKSYTTRITPKGEPVRVRARLKRR